MSDPTGHLTDSELKAMSLEDLSYKLKEAEDLALAYSMDGWTNYERLTQDSIKRIHKEIRRKANQRAK